MSNCHIGYVLGYVDFIHEAALWGRIRPLVMVKKRAADGEWKVDRSCEPGEFGATRLVFWPVIPREQAHLVHRYVRFKVEPNEKPRDPERERDEFVVAEERWNGSMRRVVSPLGLTILPENSIIDSERAVDPRSGLRSQSTVYRRKMNGTLIDGPWRVVDISDPARLCLQPREDDHVVEYTLGRLNQETYHVWDDEYGVNQAVLLTEPAKTDGRVIDHLTESGLADWLIRVFKRDKPFLTSLDRASPGWRGRIGELLETATDPVLRKLNEQRFARLDSALKALAVDESRSDDLVEMPRFKEILDAAINRKIASERGQIEAAAQEQACDALGRLGQERELAVAQAEREKQAILRELDKIRAAVADAERLRDNAQAEAQRDESSIRAAANHLVEARERIIRDFSAFHGLIESMWTSGGGSSARPLVAKTLNVPSSTRPTVVPEGPAIDDPNVFLADRLGPTMGWWGAEATRLQVKRLHAALVSCRWVATPCPSWGVAYAEAIGACARHRIVAAEPTWLSFSDAWGGEVEDFWREAVERHDELHLLIFADADRALVQCWARPLLDIVSGLRSTLPSGLAWPENLRLIACPSADEAALPVPDWVVAHWAGVRAAQGTRPDEAITPGHVPFAVWSRWGMAQRGSSRLSPGLGVAARSAALDRSALTETFRRLEPDDDPEQAKQIAREIREVNARMIFARGARA
ncbi:hypothetical protein BSF38_04773 [Paludisphaera borealis]|uniref:Uncharacterized protein n=2 Tax=Paludisphaera borealis TaxID=1387353 RepID=A0A1U7CWE2_9BACT|nr:hypothetical protein BSF38_04773 [Paludisphaera borealis]